MDSPDQRIEPGEVNPDEDGATCCGTVQEGATTHSQDELEPSADTAAKIGNPTAYLRLSIDGAC